MQSILIAGGSLAGLSAARAARAAGFEGRLIVLSAEADRPYDRPPLSKEFLAGRTVAADLALEAVHEDLDLEWHAGRTAIALDPDRLVVRDDDGQTHAADGLVLATGGTAVLPLALATAADGRQPANLLTLRTLDDSRRLRSALVTGARLVVIGAGLIGCEVAATATELGCVVTVVDLEARPLARLYGSELADALTEPHRRHGVQLAFGSTVSELRLAGDRVSAVVLDDGRVLPADVVLVAIGARATVAWLAGSGLEVGDGVICDAVGRTSRNGIVAVGDCAAWYDRRLRRPHRAQHWTDALERPAQAVGALIGVPYVPRRPFLPYFWSDQFDRKLQLAGYPALADDVGVESGDPAAGPFLAVYRQGGEPVAVLASDLPRDFMRWRKTIIGAQAE